MINDYFKLAYLSFKNRGLRSWLTILGILIGIAAVVSLIGLGEGLRFAVTSQFNFLSTDILTIQASGLNAGPPGTGVIKPLRDYYVNDIEKINGVKTSFGRIIEDAKLEFNDKTDFTFVTNIPSGPKRKDVERVVGLEAEKGRMLRDSDVNKLVLGSSYGKSDKMGKAINPGDKVLIQNKKFEVVGLMEKKGNFIIDNSIVINEDELKDLFDVNDTYDLILVNVPNRNEIQLVKERIENYLRKERDVKKGEEDFEVQSPEQNLKNLDATLFAIQIFIYVIAGISIVVGGIGISNTMYTSVMERTKQIGIMKSIGAQNKDIFTLFLIESGLLGFLGGLIGTILGSVVAYILILIGKLFLGSDLLNVKISFTLIIGALLFSFIIGSIAGILPAINASKLKPVDALRSIKWI